MKVNGKQIKIDDITNQSLNFAFGFGGYAAGKIVGKTIDRYVVNSGIKGLGMNTDSMGAKLIKPVSTLVLSAILNLSVKDKSIKTASMGMGIAGVEQAVSVFSNNTVVNGLGNENVYNNLPMTNLNLPSLDESYLQNSENHNVDGNSLETYEEVEDGILEPMYT